MNKRVDWGSEGDGQTDFFLSMYRLRFGREKAEYGNLKTGQVGKGLCVTVLNLRMETVKGEIG